MRLGEFVEREFFRNARTRKFSIDKKVKVLIKRNVLVSSS